MDSTHHGSIYTRGTYRRHDAGPLVAYHPKCAYHAQGSVDRLGAYKSRYPDQGVQSISLLLASRIQSAVRALDEATQSYLLRHSAVLRLSLLCRRSLAEILRSYHEPNPAPSVLHWLHYSGVPHHGPALHW